ncbi:MAG: hypothetical protein ACRDV9_09440 [Acidimicrobiia bacterium]
MKTLQILVAGVAAAKIAAQLTRRPVLRPAKVRAESRSPQSRGAHGEDQR